MSFCNQAAITDAVFIHLGSIHTLRMAYCNQATVTGATFSHLVGAAEVYMKGCSAATIAAAHGAGLPVIDGEEEESEDEE